MDPETEKKKEKKVKPISIPGVLLTGMHQSGLVVEIDIPESRKMFT